MTHLEMATTNLHLGIIPDGNRRWSNRNGVPVQDLIVKLFGMLGSTYKAARETPVNHLTRISAISIYLLSKDNLTKRKDDTLLMIRTGLDLVIADLHRETPILPWNSLKVNFVGEFDLLPPDILEKCRLIEANTGTLSSDFIVTAGIGYDPIEDSRRVLNGDPKRPDQRNIDLIIRTGGEMRSSGFYPMKTLYSEWFYLEKLIPDLTFVDIDQCIQQYLSRERRFGA